MARSVTIKFVSRKTKTFRSEIRIADECCSASRWYSGDGRRQIGPGPVCHSARSSHSIVVGAQLTGRLKRRRRRPTGVRQRTRPQPERRRTSTDAQVRRLRVGGGPAQRRQCHQHERLTYYSADDDRLLQRCETLL